MLFKAEGQYRKLFSVQFERRAEGLGYYVHLPYFGHTRGVLSNFVVENPDGPSQIDLRVHGTTTTERLKYAHHPDGRAHFSQDGKALTQVVTRTTPLVDSREHLFTVNFWGVEAFALAQPRDLREPMPDRASIRFDPADSSLSASQHAGSIVGTRYTMPPQGIDVDAKAAARGQIIEPVVFERWDGSQAHGIPMFPTLHQADEFFIVLSYSPLDRASGPGDSSLTVMGGFDLPEGPAGPLTGIAIHYTDRDPVTWKSLERDRGTIDLPPFLRNPNFT